MIDLQSVKFLPGNAPVWYERDDEGQWYLCQNGMKVKRDTVPQIAIGADRILDALKKSHSRRVLNAIKDIFNGHVQIVDDL